jgi:hypothetical protein
MTSDPTRIWVHNIELPLFSDFGGCILTYTIYTFCLYSCFYRYLSTYAFEKKLFFAGPELIQAYEEKHGGTAEVSYLKSDTSDS